MRISNRLFVLVTLTSYVTRGLTAPAISEGFSSLTPRGEVCSNAPDTIAGTFLHRRTLFARSPVPYRQPFNRQNPQTWCAPHCATYVKVTYISAIPGQTWKVVQDLMGGADDEARQHLRGMGDGVVSEGTFSFQQSGMEVFVHDSNNHQVTWGVLDASLRALTEYFDDIQRNDAALPGSITFVVHDGKNEVATGGLGAVQPDSFRR